MPRTTPIITNANSEQQSLLTLARSLYTNSLVDRASLDRYIGRSYKTTTGAKRDIYEALGYDTEINFNMFLARYLRQDIAQRIVEAPVTDSWRLAPVITEDQDATKQTPFEEAWSDLEKKHNILHYMERADKISGIGRYGGLFVGFKGEVGGLNIPVQTATAREIQIIAPYHEGSLDIRTIGEDINNERYHLPEMYTIKSQGTSPSLNVHWSRIIHIAENLLEDDVFGQPRLRAVWNRLEDIERIVGGSAEMFWRGAFPGLAFILDEDAEMGIQTKKELEEQIRGYIHGLMRYLKLQAMKIQELKPQVADPSNHLDTELKLVSAQTRMPNRILLGTERGELASSQDEEAWDRRIDTRREKYITPKIIRPFIDRMMDYGILPKVDNYEVRWPALQDASDLESAEVGEKIANTLSKYAGTAAEGVLPLEMFLELVLKLDQKQIEKAVKLGTDVRDEEAKQIEEDNKRLADEAKAVAAAKGNG